MPMREVVERLGIAGLVRSGGELVGPCPQCGGIDRFGVNLQHPVWGCRKCATGGDQVALVRHVLGLDFRAALDWLCGPASGLDAAQAEARARRAAENRRAQAEVARRERAKAISQARRIWGESVPAEGTAVRDYLALRGIPATRLPVLPAALRFAPAARYVIPAGRRGEYSEIHRGPAMVAAIRNPAGEITAVHRTWLDLTRANGKAELGLDPAGRPWPAKKVLGSKKGGAIRLRSPEGATTLVMGEGIETTLSALLAEPPPGGAAFWAGVDLGNMGGRRQRGEGLKFAGIPDLEDGEAFLPPSCICHLVYVQDGDSDPRLTRATLEAGLRRAMALRPGLTGGIVRAAEGRDLNDMLREGA